MNTLPSAVEIRKTIRPLLPNDAFGAQSGQLLTIFAHFALAVACLYAARQTERLWLCALLGFVIGNSSYGLASMCHYMSHGSIVRGVRRRYLLEAFFWGWLGHSATVWAKTHNKAHHAHANGPADTDRRFAKAEARWDRTLFHALFYPTRHFRWNPLTLLTYGVLSSTYMITGLLGLSRDASPMGPVVCAYSRKERLRIVLELTWAYGLQVWVYHFLGFEKYLAVILVAYFVTNGISSIYLHTQHGLMPLSSSEEEHPLTSTTNVRVHPVFDWLHNHVSYHIEHHLFPSLNHKYAPMLSRLLQEHYGAHYRSKSLGEAWRELFTNELYLEPEQPASSDARAA